MFAIFALVLICSALIYWTRADFHLRLAHFFFLLVDRTLPTHDSLPAFCCFLSYAHYCAGVHFGWFSFRIFFYLWVLLFFFFFFLFFFKWFKSTKYNIEYAEQKAEQGQSAKAKRFFWIEWVRCWAVDKLFFHSILSKSSSIDSACKVLLIDLGLIFFIE